MRNILSYNLPVQLILIWDNKGKEEHYSLVTMTGKLAVCSTKVRRP